MYNNPYICDSKCTILIFRRQMIFCILELNYNRKYNVLLVLRIIYKNIWLLRERLDLFGACCENRLAMKKSSKINCRIKCYLRPTFRTFREKKYSRHVNPILCVY